MNDNLPSQLEYKKYNYKLTPFKLCVLQNFPYIEADFDAITNYQLLCKVVEYLNHVIDNQNTVEDNFKIMADNLNILYNFLDTLDLQDEVNNKLDEMAEDGTLDNIINNVLNKINDSLVCNIDYRDCTEFINGVVDESSPIKGYLQGFTTTPTSYIVAIQTGGNYENKTNMIYLEEISKSTKQILKSAYLELFHANAIAYNHQNKEIYVATLYKRNADNTTTDTNNIIIVDYNNFTIKETISLPTEITNVSRISSVSYDNKNNVLAISDDTNVYIMENWNTILRHIQLNYNYTAPNINPITNTFTTQNIILYDNKIYSIRAFPSAIVVFDLNGNVLNNYYQFNIDIPLKIGELESISIEDDGTLYLASVQQAVSNNNNCMLYDRTIFKTNLKYNGYKNYRESQILSNRITFYVNCDTTNNIQAGSESLPFKSIQQAIFATEFIERKVCCVIYLMGNNKQYGFFVTKNNNNIIIEGGYNKIYAIQIESQKIRINKLKIVEDILVNVTNSTEDQSNLFISNHSNVILDDFEIINNSENVIENGLVIYFSTLLCHYIKANKLNNIFRLFNYATLNCASIDDTNCNYYFYTNYNATINYNQHNLFNKLNPLSQTNICIPTYQSLDFTYTNNVISMNNKNIDEIANRVYLIRYYVNIENDWRYRNTIIVGASYDYYEIVTANYIYKIQINFIRNATGEYQLTPVIRKKDKANNTETDITSNTTIKVVSIRLIP